MRRIRTKRATLLGCCAATQLIISAFVYWNSFDEYPQHLTPIRDLLSASLEANSLSSADGTRIAIVSVLDRTELIEEFQFALGTVHCFCLRHPNYSHLVLFSPTATNSSADSGLGEFSALSEGNEQCQHIHDFMFRRHCFVAVWMRRHPQFGWLLFLDADMGVVNPEHTLEQFIGPSPTELVFIDRLFNFEVMAGSYLARNSPYARSLLHSWADLSFRLPNSTHGSDNGAIHALFIERFAALSAKNACQHLWEQSRSFSDLFIFEACTRFHYSQNAQNGTFDGGRVRVLGKGQGWVRDGGLTGTRFSRRDFMLHGWKNSTFNRSVFLPWKNPFAAEQRFDLSSQCANATRQWVYRPGYLVEEAHIRRTLDALILDSRAEFTETLRRLNLGIA